MNPLREAAAVWSSGYCTDVPYTVGSYKHMSPTFLAASVGLQGYVAPDCSGAFNYLELGCGHGVSIAANAAMYPQGQFYAIDFNPEHITFLQEFAAEVGLRNLHAQEKSFSDVADALDGAYPQFDIICLHGVWSWISSENRAHILRIIRRYLKTGGLVYNSYNCQPGWSALLPIRQVVYQHAACNSASSDVMAVEGLRYAAQLIESGSAFDRLFPQAKTTIEYSLANKKLAYLAHEWLSKDLYTPFSSEVIDEMAGVGCRFIGSSDPSVNMTAHTESCRSIHLSNVELVKSDERCG